MKGGKALSIPCGCNGPDPELEKTPTEEELSKPGYPAECPVIVYDTVCAQADVTIMPKVKTGPIRTACIGKPFIGKCIGVPSPCNSCTFTVSQKIWVQIPLTFAAHADVCPTGIVCGMPSVGPCA